MRVLVTGSSGFIGAAVRRHLAERGDECHSFDHLDGHNVLDRHDLAAAVVHADAVINLAGRLGTSETFGKERSTAEVNIIGALNVADVCHTYDRPMVQIGTGHKGQPNPYAITKGCAEDLLLARAKELKQPISVVRAFHAYGPGQKACPPHGTSTVRKFIPSFVCRALTGLPLEIHGSGQQTVDPIHVDEVARILVAAIGGPYGYVLDAGCGQPVTINQVALDVWAATGSESEIVHIDNRPGEPPDSAVIAERPESALVWPWRLDETIDYYRSVLA